MVLAGNIPIYVVRNEQKQYEISTIVDAAIDIRCKSCFGYLPVFKSKKKAEIFTDRIRRMRIPFGGSVRSVRVRLHNIE